MTCFFFALNLQYFYLILRKQLALLPTAKQSAVVTMSIPCGKVPYERREKQKSYLIPNFYFEKLLAHYQNNFPLEKKIYILLYKFNHRMKLLVIMQINFQKLLVDRRQVLKLLRQKAEAYSVFFNCLDIHSKFILKAKLYRSI